MTEPGNGPVQSRIGLSSACIAAVTSGILGALAFPSTNLHGLVWVAFVPLLVAIDGQSTRVQFLLGMITGLVGFAIAWPWVWSSIADYFLLSRSAAAVFFALFLIWQSLQLACFCVVTGVTKGYRYIATPLAWVVLEWFFPKLFPWQLGLALEPHLPFIQLADVGGTALLGFLVLFANSALAIGVRSNHRRIRVTAICLALAVPMMLEVHGRWRIAVVEAADLHASQWKVAIVQGNIPPAHQPTPEQIARSFEVHAELSRQLAPQRPNLIIWPESALRVDLTHDAAMFEAVAALARTTGTLLFVGAAGSTEDGGETSSAFLISPSADLVGGYSKVHPFPFAERLPPGFAFLRRFLPMSEITAGDSTRALLLPGTRAAPSICYEATFPGFFNRAVAEGAEFAINITNDAWFGNSSGPRHHLQAAVLRAVESRRWLVRAANTGISAVIGASGRTAMATELLAPATLLARIPLRKDESLYVRHGDWFPWGCLLVLAIVVIVDRKGVDGSSVD